MEITVGEEQLRVGRAPVNTDERDESINPILQQLGFCYMICGAPGSGKSNLIWNMLNRKNAGMYRGVFDSVHVFCPSKTLDYGSDVEVHEQVDMEEIQMILDDPELLGLRVLFVFDDVVREMKRAARPLLRVFDNRRHLFNDPETHLGNLSVMIAVQKFTALPLDFRTDCSAYFLFKPDHREARRVYDDVMSAYMPSFEHWRRLMDVVYGSRKHDFLYVDKKTGKLYKNFSPMQVLLRAE